MIVHFFYYNVLSDEEAMKLIQKEPSRQNSKEHWKETQTGSILVTIIALHCIINMIIN